jgi:hypothetical protein
LPAGHAFSLKWTAHLIPSPWKGEGQGVGRVIPSPCKGEGQGVGRVIPSPSGRGRG